MVRPAPHRAAAPRRRRPRRGRGRAGRLRQLAQAGAGLDRVAGRLLGDRPLGDDLALPPGPRRQPLPHRPGGDARRGERRHPGRAERAGGTPAGRLLLRLPDDQRRADGQRRPRRRVSPGGGRDRAGLSLLPGLPRLRARLPPDHAERARPSRARSPSRTPSSPTAACSPPSATTSPTTTTAAGSSSSATPRARRS